MRFRTAAAAWTVAAALAAGGCGGVIDPSRNDVVDFSGTMEPQGAADIHEFQSDNGEYDVRITALAPTGSGGLTLTLAQLRNGFCEPINQNAGTVTNQTVLAGRITSGRYCLAVSDFFLTDTVNYTVRVSHP